MLRVLSIALCLAACGSSSDELAQGSAAISSITLPQSLRLDTVRSRTARLTPGVEPIAASTAALAWHSAAPDIARVDDSGLVTAVAPGTADIRVSTPDGKQHATCKVYVFAPWLADDFERGSTSTWDLRPPAGPDGTFSVIDDGGSVLKYEAGSVGGVLATVTQTSWARVPGGDYYVQARIKPLSNASTGNKQLYLLARYQDDKNWYGAGLNVQSSTASTQVEIAKLKDGTLSRPAQVKAPIMQDSTWYTVRFELQGSTLTVYLDGVLIKSVTDEQWQQGPIGLYTANKSFEIDDIEVGDPRDRPLQLSLDASSWRTEAQGDPKEVHVKAQKPSYDDGSYTADNFVVASSDPEIVSLAIAGETVTLTARRAGEATVTFYSASDPALTRTLQITVEPQFVQPDATYALAGRSLPAAGEARAYADTRLSLTFDAPPSLGDHGSVRIFRKRDGARVDVIRLQDETDTLGPRGADNRRYVYSAERIQVSGNALRVAPHGGVLEPDTQYYVAIAEGLVTGPLGGAAFRGIGERGGWTFRTRPAVDPGKSTVVVDDDGDQADFRSVQGALDFVMQKTDAQAPVTIRVKNGRYQELLFLRGHDNVSIVGESRAGVVIAYRNSEAQNGGSGASQAPGSGTPAGGRAVFLVEDADLLSLDSLTLENTTRRSASAASQAETVYFNADAGRLIARNADFISEQDTLQLKGYAWFYQTLVAGNVDFIWGANHAALFEDGEIRSLGDSAAADRGFVVQARSVAQRDPGFVFLRSRFTHGRGPGGADAPAGPDAATFLARSSGNASAWENVAVVDCELGDHIHPLGWAYEVGGQPRSNPSTSSADSGWREYGSRGPGAAT